MASPPAAVTDSDPLPLMLPDEPVTLSELTDTAARLESPATNRLEPAVMAPTTANVPSRELAPLTLIVEKLHAPHALELLELFTQLELHAAEDEDDEEEEPLSKLDNSTVELPFDRYTFVAFSKMLSFETVM